MKNPFHSNLFYIRHFIETTERILIDNKQSDRFRIYLQMAFLTSIIFHQLFLQFAELTKYERFLQFDQVYFLLPNQMRCQFRGMIIMQAMVAIQMFYSFKFKMPPILMYSFKKFINSINPNIDTKKMYFISLTNSIVPEDAALIATRRHFHRTRRLFSFYQLVICKFYFIINKNN